jgi:hypothetical protein
MLRKYSGSILDVESQLKCLLLHRAPFEEKNVTSRPSLDLLRVRWYPCCLRYIPVGRVSPASVHSRRWAVINSSFHRLSDCEIASATPSNSPSSSSAYKKSTN